MNNTLRFAAIAALAIITVPASAQYSSSKPSGNISATNHKSAKQAKNTTVTAPPETSAEFADEARSSEAPALATRPKDGNVVLPVGTAIRMKLTSAISTHGSKEGDVFMGRVSEDVVVAGKTVIPKGSNLNGRVTGLSEPRRIAGRPSIQLMPYWVTLSNGQVLSITASVVDTNDPGTYSVNEEGKIKGPGISKQDKVEFVAAAGAGTIVGSVIKLGTGTWVGAAAGAAFATGHWLIRRHSLELPEGTELVMEINNPVTTQAAPVPNTAQGGN